MTQLLTRVIGDSPEIHLGDHNDVIRPVHNKIENAVLTATVDQGFVMGAGGVLIPIDLATQAELNAHAATAHGGAIRVEDEGGTVVAGATGMNFAGAGVTVTDAGSNEALVTIPGGGSGVTVQDEGTPLATAGTTLNFVGAGVTATGTGATKTLTIPGGSSGITVQDENGNVGTGVTQIDFQGAGISAASGTGEIVVTVPGGTNGIRVEDENTTAVAVATAINFAGAGVTATDAGSGEVTVTIPGGGSGITVQDEGSSLATSGTIVNFTGAGVTATGTGATKTIDIPGSATSGLAGYYDVSKAPYNVLPASTAAAVRSGILAAIDAAAAAGGGVVYVPPGTYDCAMAAHPLAAIRSCMLYIKAKVELRGAGPGVTILRLPNNSTGNTYTDLVVNYNAETAVDTDIIIRDITIDGNAANQHSTTQSYNSGTTGGKGTGWTGDHANANGNAIGMNSTGIAFRRAKRCKAINVEVKDSRGTSYVGDGTETFHFEAWLSTQIDFINCDVVGTTTRHIFDGTINSGSTSVSSAGTPFTAADVGATLSSKHHPTQTRILSVSGGVATVSYAATSGATAGSGIFTVGRTATGFSTDYSNQIRRIGCRAIGMGIGNGFTCYNTRGVRDIGCTSILNHGHGMNYELAYDNANIGCMVGGHANVTSEAPYPFVPNETYGNISHGITLHGGGPHQVDGSLIQDNGRGQEAGWDIGLSVHHHLTGTGNGPVERVNITNTVIRGNRIGVQLYGGGLGGPASRVNISNPGLIYENIVTNIDAPESWFYSSGWMNYTPPIPASTTRLRTPFPFATIWVVTGGTVSAIATDGWDQANEQTEGVTSGPIFVPAGGSIKLTYSVAPTWKVKAACS